MARIEKTVFISYRRTDVYTALAVYESLKNQGYDVFFDYTSISSGDFEQIITANIKARAHFLLILTPTALNRCSEPGDWVRREIEMAIEEKRNIIPLFFQGFRFGAPEVSKQMTGKLKNLSRYNGLNVHEDYFEEAMQRVRTQFLSIPLDTVLHPVSTEVMKVVKEEKVAADEALMHKEVKQEPKVEPAPAPVAPSKMQEKSELDILKSQAIQYELRGDLYSALQTYYKIKRLDPLFPSVDLKVKQLEIELQPEPVARTARVSEEAVGQQGRSSVLPWRLIAGLAGGIAVIAFLIWGGINLWSNLPSSTPEPTRISHPTATKTIKSVTTNTPLLTETFIPSTPSPTKTSISLIETPTLGVGSTMTGKDGMTLLYIPAGEFIMGYDSSWDDQKPAHNVFLSDFWIDKTEVTVGMYLFCVNAGECKEPPSRGSYTQSSYYGDAEFDNYPVIYVDWNMATAYCKWVDRHLPTEAEWEKAARGTDGRIYPWGNERPNYDLLNYMDIFGDTTPVNEYPNGASPYGALNMAGNVWEWVADWYDASYYANSPLNNPSGSPHGEYHVLRGGSFHGFFDIVSTTYRGWLDPEGRMKLGIGFRCAMSANP